MVVVEKYRRTLGDRTSSAATLGSLKIPVKVQSDNLFSLTVQDLTTG